MTESKPLPKESGFADRSCVERAPRNLLFDYDCQSIPEYQNQEEYFRDLAERAFY